MWLFCLRITATRCIPLNLRSKNDREQHFCFLPRFTSVNRGDGQLHTSIYNKHNDFNFHITQFPFLGSNIPGWPAYGVLYKLYDIPGLVPRMGVFSEGDTALRQGTLEIVIWEILWSIRGSYQTIKNSPLTNDIMQWSYTMTTNYWSDLYQAMTLLPISVFYSILIRSNSIEHLR